MYSEDFFKYHALCLLWVECKSFLSFYSFLMFSLSKAPENLKWPRHMVATLECVCIFIIWQVYGEQSSWATAGGWHCQCFLHHCLPLAQKIESPQKMLVEDNKVMWYHFVGFRVFFFKNWYHWVCISKKGVGGWMW
jgi:hypothetical protein